MTESFWKINRKHRKFGWYFTMKISIKAQFLFSSLLKCFRTKPELTNNLAAYLDLNQFALIYCTIRVLLLCYCSYVERYETWNSKLNSELRLKRSYELHKYFCSSKDESFLCYQLIISTETWYKKRWRSSTFRDNNDSFLKVFLYRWKESCKIQ